MGGSCGDFCRHGNGSGSGGGRRGVSEKYIPLSLSKRCTASAL